MKRLALLGIAASLYVLAAWAVTPGFYDCCATAPTYNWVCPPSDLAPGNLSPGSGHADIPVTNGVSDPSSAVTSDGQLGIGFPPGVFDATSASSIAVEITPVSPCPQPADLRFATNTYEITATAQLVKDANLKLDFSGNVPAPSNVYFASSPDGPWTSIGAAPYSQQYTIDTTTRRLGYFAAGYAANAISLGTASQLLPIAVAVLIVGVLVAGVPLAVVRRRRAAAGPDDADESDDG